ncbi:hypothetical protein TSUD_288690 [Trifolium subterraneum]|uniref:Uncharacterized protein n=1 Tax=Trifolium subterraneum TaxID=3900 RepID=A0A2Z6N7T2_TRISU|nr:hypothetical protein TSUD_288690 [Trifolium subterraneum]
MEFNLILLFNQIRFFSSTRLSYAQYYGGHQFGAGKTPYSRFANALQCSVAASGSSFAVKRFITWGYQQSVLFVL